MPEGPELTDGVVTLRPWTVGDSPFFLEACRDAEIRRFWLRQPLESIDDAIEMGEAAVAAWSEYRHSGGMRGLPFLIAETASGARSGLCGVDEWSADDSVQVGYFLAASARGRGYATRAVRLLTDWLFALGATRAFATVDPLNVASVAVLTRVGFAYDKTLPEHGAHDGRRYDLACYQKSRPG